jgi:transcription termination factor NusA
MAMEILEAFGQLTREKALDRGEVIELVKAGMLAAVRRKYGAEANAEIDVDPTTGDIKITRVVEVVPTAADVEDPSRQMSIEEARLLPPEQPWGTGDPEPGMVAEIPLDFRTFGRNAIQAAKQMIIQKVREEERERIREEYADKVGQLVTGTVQQVDRGNALVFLDRRTEAILPAREQVRREYLRQGESVRALLLDIKETSKGPQLILSRTHPEFVMQLFALEVPEVYQGIVEIRAIAREPGSRSKIAVWSRDPHVDPVGACVGLKGSRVQAVVSELGGERIDIVPWTDEPRQFIAQSLSPAEVYKIILHEPGGGIDESGLFGGEAFRRSPFVKPQPRFRGPTAAPAPFQPASPEETAAVLDASKAALEEARREAGRGVEEIVEAEPEVPAAPEKRATVVCAEDQLSLAIGRAGQNVRLASKLTGYKIDLISKSDYLAKEEEILFGRKAEPAAEAATAMIGVEGEADFPLNQVPGIEPETVGVLAARGFTTFNDIINLEYDELVAIPGMDQRTAELLMGIIDELTVEVDEEWDEEAEKYVEAEPEDAGGGSEEPERAEEPEPAEQAEPAGEPERAGE